jgi:myo-inositol-1(or 4)-monophosphatase
MPFRNRDQFLDSVEAVARLGAERLVPRFRSLSPDQVTEKSRNDLVSVADRESEEVILRAISERFPDHAVLSEEAGWARRDPARPTWVVDPLDGTTNFVHGFAQFAVSIGVVMDGVVEFGVVLDPVKGDIFRAARGAGATWNGTPCRIAERSSLRGALLATGFPFRAHHLLDPYLGIFKEVFLRAKAVRRPGAAALDLAYTGAGVFDGFFEFALSPWDVAAGSLIVEEAGGRVVDMTGGGDCLGTGHILCGPAGVVDELLEVVGGFRGSWDRADLPAID